MIYEQMLREKSNIEKQIQNLKIQLIDLPEGSLYCSKSGKYVKWFYYNGETQTYLPKKERKLAEQLALKKYISVRIKNLENEKQAIENYLKCHKKETHQEEEALVSSVEYRELLSSYFQPISQELSDWQTSPYEKHDKYTEFLLHDTPTGERVRSKSEAMIYSSLYKHRIPFRYEAVLQLGDVQLYPDFTIRHPRTGKFYYWEHFGMVQDSNYSKNVISKLQLYMNYGIFPTIHLISTYETRENPLTMKKIEDTIQYYFGT